MVSGGARGIDSAAHEGALRGESPTVVALACGLDHVYPPENKNLFQKIINNGGTNPFLNTRRGRRLWGGSFREEQDYRGNEPGESLW